MITDLGYIAFVLAFLLAIYGIVVSIVGGLRRLPELVASGRNAIYVVGALVLLAVAAPLAGPADERVSGRVVATHTERSAADLLQDLGALGRPGRFAALLDADRLRFCGGGHLVLPQAGAQPASLGSMPSC